MGDRPSPLLIRPGSGLAALGALAGIVQWAKRAETPSPLPLDVPVRRREGRRARNAGKAARAHRRRRRGTVIAAASRKRNR